jgi:hypothetical protein
MRSDNQWREPEHGFKLAAFTEPSEAKLPHGRVAGAAGTDAQGARRFRPFARRALMTARPPRVFMRARNPCVRARRILDAWYVRFMILVSPLARSFPWNDDSSLCVPSRMFSGNLGLQQKGPVRSMRTTVRWQSHGRREIVPGTVDNRRRWDPSTYNARSQRKCSPQDGGRLMAARMRTSRRGNARATVQHVDPPFAGRGRHGACGRRGRRDGAGAESVQAGLDSKPIRTAH